MNFKKPKRSQGPGPETIAGTRLRRFMQARGWYVKKIHCNKYMTGLPDYYTHHPIHGHKWIEMKVPGGNLRPSQKREFPKMEKGGDQIYILRDEGDYYLLFEKKGNWRKFLKVSELWEIND